jgi:hypothetical protein
MPNLETLILSSPLGFVNTSLRLNAQAKEENEQFDAIVAAAWQQSQSGVTNSSDEVKAIAFIIRSMKQAQPSSSLPQTANVLASTTVLSKEAIERLLIKVKELSDQEPDKTEKAIHVSKVVEEGTTIKLKRFYVGRVS